MFVTIIQRRFPPSSVLRRLTACSVVPEPAKKSTIRALGLFDTKKRRTSCTAYRDFGKVNRLPIIL